MDYIKLDRKIMEWEWYSDINTCRLFVHMLLKANWKEAKFKGTTVPRGSFVSSIGKLSLETNLTVDEVRTAISKLIRTNEITKQSTNKFTVFTVKNYDIYQDCPRQETSQVPARSQPIPNLFPTIEEYKEGKKGRKDIEVSKDTINCTDVQCVVEAWNSVGVTRITGIKTDTQRYRMLKARIKEYGTDQVLMAIDNIRESPFLRGSNNKGWEIKFDWFIKPNNFIKVLEGNYNGGTSRQIPAKNKWAPSEQNSYDFAALEKELLSN